MWTAEQPGNNEFYPYDDAAICDAARNSILEAMNNLNEGQGECGPGLTCELAVVPYVACGTNDVKPAGLSGLHEAR